MGGVHAGTSGSLVFSGPYCGKDFTGGSCSITYNAVRGRGIGGSVSMCGGFAGAVDIGPQFGAQLAISYDLCYVHVLSCSNQPCECE